MYRTLFPGELLTEFDRLQREMSSLFEPTPAIRGRGRGGPPALDVVSSPTSVDVYAFALGLDPATFEVNLERGVLTISGERKGQAGANDARATLHPEERFTGRFRRVVSLPDDIDPNVVGASYTDGVLRVGIHRREAAQPRRITVQ